MNVTVKSLERIHGKENAPAVFDEIAELSGAGRVPGGYEGGIDLTGVLDDENKAITAASKRRIMELVGEKKEDEVAIDESQKKRGSK